MLSKIQKLLKRKREECIIELVNGKNLQVFITRFNDSRFYLRLPGIVKSFHTESACLDWIANRLPAVTYKFTFWEERGYFSFNVTNPENDTDVYSVSDDYFLFDAGYMKHIQDIAGLEEYLKDMKVIREKDCIVQGN